jgi:Domain of unknown function (DUF6046)
MRPGLNLINLFQNQVPPSGQLDKPLYYGDLGTPIFSNLEIQGGSYTDEFGKQVTFAGITIDTILYTVNQSKEIVKTIMQGRPGSVKEYICDGDYNILISGIITGGNGLHPYDAVSQLKAILDAPVALNINSKYLQNLGIYSIVVEDYTIGQSVGSMGQQPFNITAVSDVPVILQIK